MSSQTSAPAVSDGVRTTISGAAAAAAAPAEAPTAEHAELLATLGRHRFFLTNTLRGLDEQAVRRRSSASELTLASIVQHVTRTEAQWARFIVEGPGALEGGDQTGGSHDWSVPDDVTIADLLAAHAAVAAETERIVLETPDLSVSHPLPAAPWFPPGARWSARRVLLHLLAETSQHAGHADIVRESIDGAKSMG